MKWKPFEWFALRGTYAQGFRAPNVAESGKVGGLAAFANVSDPVRCAATGGSGAECAPRFVSVITSPNPDLKPEKSNSYTLGMVFQPTSSTSMTVDGWQIKRTKEIAQIGTVDAINAGDVIRDDNLLKVLALVSCLGSRPNTSISTPLQHVVWILTYSSVLPWVDSVI